MDDELIHEIFAELGPVTVRRMFGGKGIYHDGIIVAIVLRDGELMLKGDKQTAPALEQAGARRWNYEGRKGRVAMPYWSVPESAMDDPDEMAVWVRQAFEAAQRASNAQPGR